MAKARSTGAGERPPEAPSPGAATGTEPHADAPSLADERLALVLRAQAELPYATRAFEALAKRYYGLVRQIAFGILGDRDHAESVAQETMMRVFHGLPKLKDPAIFEGWLRRIVVNTANTFLRREIREREKVDQRHADPASAPAVSVSGPDELDEDQAFAELIASLNIEERTILTFRFVEDLEFQEIAAITGLGLSATKMRFYRALKKVQAQPDATAELPD